MSENDLSGSEGGAPHERPYPYRKNRSFATETPSKTAEATRWRTRLPGSRRIVYESGTIFIRSAESMTLVI